ncbi:hypothetical protein GCM10027275_06180 [Rhabdobacter roseus]|uniref:6-phosphogluconate dehydrogenase n=1 Tax=Rhabdobacter roseus TaxID=1655419 RepID=A0A840TLS9_9BACT|nr:hypothetical protein [Rhabdobacter roseus]MBB5282512.1 hypothetical protein [Rhabdobacter roseus]
MRKWIILFVFLAIVLGILYYISFGYYSEGKRGGFVVKLSKRGYVFKTYEGVLNVGGLYDGGGTMSATQWDFSIGSSNQEGIQKIEEAIRTGRRVSLTYQEKFFVLPWNGDTEYFVTDVQLLDTPQYPQNPLYQEEQTTPPLPARPAPLPELDSSAEVL